jgi:hypothetical protein
MQCSGVFGIKFAGTACEVGAHLRGRVGHEGSLGCRVENRTPGSYCTHVFVRMTGEQGTVPGKTGTMPTRLYRGHGQPRDGKPEY